MENIGKSKKRVCVNLIAGITGSTTVHMQCAAMCVCVCVCVCLCVCVCVCVCVVCVCVCVCVY